MRVLRSGAGLVLGAAILGSAAPAAAQPDSLGSRPFFGTYDGPRRLEFSATVGHTFSTSWSDLVAFQVLDPNGGVHRQVLLRDISAGPEVGFDGAITYWRGRHGFRVHGGYTKSCLTTAARCNGDDTPPPANGAALAVAEVPMDVWRYGVQGIVGLRNWADSRNFRPYIIIGGGGVTYDPRDDVLPFFPGTFETLVPPGTPPGTVVIRDGASAFLISTPELNREHLLSGTLGIGVDLRAPVGLGGAAIRIELVDQFARSPFDVRVARLDDAGRWSRGIDEVTFRGGVVHNLRLSAGVAIELPLRGPTTEYDPWEEWRSR